MCLRYRRSKSNRKPWSISRPGANPRPNAWWVWGMCLDDQGKKAEALEKYQKVTELNPIFLPAQLRVQALKGEFALRKKEAEKKELEKKAPEKE